MKTRLPLLCCISIFLTAGANAQVQITNVPDPAEWKRYTVKGEEFSVALPKPPFMMTVGVAGERGSIRRAERSIVVVTGGVTYAVYAYENPGPRKSLADFIAKQTAKYSKDLFLDRSVEINGVVGREYTSQDANNQPTTEQFFATEEHLYKFGVYGASADDERAKRFFSSIMLGKNPEGIAVDEKPNVSLADVSSPADSSPPTRADEIFTAREVDQRARITKRVPPGYSEEARRHKVSGTVILKLLLSATGEVTNIRVVSGLPYGLTERAIAAARKIEFIPAMKDGKPVSMWVDVEFNFDIY